MNNTPAHSTSAAEGAVAGTPFPARRMASLMRRALFLAEGNLGATAPNPSVGAVIADAATGEIVASAVTAPGGRPHAEVLALKQAGERARGSVLFTTLEPCSHFGATPPCAHSVAEAGVATVVYGSLDPDMRVAGRGLAWLESHGVKVLRSEFAKQADWLNLGHALRVTERRPFVQIKLAVDADGRVPAGAGGQPVWVTGEAARAQAHLLRARADAILVGRKTVEADDPELTCRLPGLEDRSPIRVVLAPRCDIPAQARLFKSQKPPVWIVCGDSSKCGGLTGLPGVKVFDVGASTAGSLSLRLVLIAPCRGRHHAPSRRGRPNHGPRLPRCRPCGRGHHHAKRDAARPRIKPSRLCRPWFGAGNIFKFIYIGRSLEGRSRYRPQLPFHRSLAGMIRYVHRSRTS